MPGFTKGMRDYYAFLFGDSSNGNLVITSSTVFASTLNGGLVTRNFRNLTINSGAIISVANPCKGLLIRVSDTLTLNGSISMSLKAGAVPGGGSDLFLHYSDIKIPRIGAPGGTVSGADGSNGTDGQCGGGGAGGTASHHPYTSLFGKGAAGYVAGGGQGGGGGCAGRVDMHYTMMHNVWNAENAQPYGQGRGDWGGWVQNGQVYPDSEPISLNGRGGQGGAIGGGILIVMARRIIGNGLLISDGAAATAPPEDTRRGESSGAGGAGGGSIVVFYGTMQTLNMLARGGAGTPKMTDTGVDGGKGGNGSCRAWSLTELASHTRI